MKIPNAAIRLSTCNKARQGKNHIRMSPRTWVRQLQGIAEDCLQSSSLLITLASIGWAIISSSTLLDHKQVSGEVNLAWVFVHHYDVLEICRTWIRPVNGHFKPESVCWRRCELRVASLRLAALEAAHCIVASWVCWCCWTACTTCAYVYNILRLAYIISYAIVSIRNSLMPGGVQFSHCWTVRACTSCDAAFLGAKQQ